MSEQIIVAEIARRAIWPVVKSAFANWKAGQIKITDHILKNPRPAGGVQISYEVRGELKRLPKGYWPWLLVQDDDSKKVWPQGFYKVSYDERTGRWTGRVTPAKIFGGLGHRAFIIAVVAPPTSIEFFNYYERVNSSHGGNWVPLDSVPAECTNRHIVLATFP